MASLAFTVTIEDFEIECFVSPWNIRAKVSASFNGIRSEMKPFDLPRLKWDDIRQRLLTFGFKETVVEVDKGFGGTYRYRIDGELLNA